MSNKRGANMKHWAAIRRRARRIDQVRADSGEGFIVPAGTRVVPYQPGQTRPPRPESPGKIAHLAIRGGGADSQTGGIAVSEALDLTDVLIQDCGTGLIIGPAGDVKADGLVTRRNGTGIANQGQFDGQDTTVE
jgi:hypothetical protein